jgi:cobalt-zinc-cadmium efflux system outer membrane protein
VTTPFRAAAWLLLLSGAARAQTSTPVPPLRLSEALQLAREHNPDLAAARADLEAAHAQRDAAVALPNPVLAYSTSKIPTDGTPAGTIYGNDFYSRSYDTVVSAGELVEIGGKRSNRRSSADAGIAAAEARLADAERLLDASVVKAYVAAAVASRSAALTRDSADSFARSETIAREREAAGDLSAADRAQIEIAAGKFLADAAQSDLAAANARRALAALLGRPAVVLADDLDALAGGDEDAGNDVSALAKRPDLLALDAAVRRADADLGLQKAFRVPDPTLSIQYEREPPDQRNTFGFGVSLPLPLFNRNAGGIRAATVAAESARRDLVKGRLRAEQDLAATRDALESARARAARLSGELAPKARSVRETVRYAWEQGGASLLELLESERNANDLLLAAAAAEGDLAAARADYRAARLLAVHPERSEP